MIDKAWGPPGFRSRAADPVRLCRAVAILTFLFLPLLAPASRGAAQSPPPHESYRTLHTENFRITFPRGLEEVAERAADRAERAHASLRGGPLPPPAGPIHVLLTDHVDLSNGFASVAPYNRMVIWLSPPLDGMGLSHFDEWLDLVIVHELAHLFHLDYVGTPGRIARAVFGRAPRRWPFFLGNALPTLAVEGFAVQQESALTEGGRLHGTFQEAVVRSHALGDRLESVGQGLGNSPLWPGGNRPYAYGALFFHHLAERYGDEAVVRFLKTVAGQWIPYRLDAASHRAFGASFSALWNEWREEMLLEVARMERSLDGPETGGAPELLTRGGRMALHAAPHPGGDGTVAYFRSDGRTDPRLSVLGPEGEERWGVRWNGLARPVWTPGGDLVAPQLEYMDAFRIRSDVYRVTPSGEVVRLTRGLRVTAVDSSPRDGRLAAVLEEGGTNRLALLAPDGEVIRVLREVDPGVHWSHPRWSPDGRRIAVSSWRTGGWTQIQVLDTDGRTLASTDEDRSLHAAPAWSADGRFLIWTSDRTGVMNVYAREVSALASEDDLDRGTGAVGATGRSAESSGGTGDGVAESGASPALALGELRQVTRFVAPGHFPAVSPDGRWLYLSVLREAGWELARVPFDPDGWSDPLPLDPRFEEGGHRLDEGEDARITGPFASYSALATLRPRYWLPLHRSPRRVSGVDVLPRAVGFETSATDLVGRHSYALEATTSLQDPGRRLDLAARYSWAGLGNPVLFVEGGQRWPDPFLLVTRPEEGAPLDSLFHAARERSLGAGMELRHQRMRHAVRLTLSGRVVSRDRTLRELDLSVSDRYQLLRPSSELLEGRASLSFGRARAFPFSVSTQEGIAAAITVRERWEPALPDSLRGLPGVDGALRDVVGSVAGYRGIGGPGFAKHVLALRVAAGTVRGPGAGNDHFGVGGGGGGGQGTLGFTYDASRGAFPVRGFPLGSARGQSAWAASAEWRFPLTIIHRGIGAWPLHLDRLSGSVFVDGAGARRLDPAGAEAWTTLASAGVELGLVRTFLFESPVLLRGGVAAPIEGPGSPSVYLGFGWGF